MESQIETFLRSLTIPPPVAAWVQDELANASVGKREVADARRKSLGRLVKDIGNQLEELTGLRLRGLVDDQEFLDRRTKLQEERLRLQKRLLVDNQGDEWFEPFREVISFSNRAADWFLAGDAATKRAILETVCSNPTLSGKILSIEAAKPFSMSAQSASCPIQLGVLEEVRTQTPQKEWDRIVANIRMLRARFEPESVVRETKPRRGSRPRTEDLVN